jgi:RNA-directed DNA polymerase
MPKRTGYLYEKVVSKENCTAAVIEMTKGKHKNRRAMYMRENAEAYGAALAAELSGDRWDPRPYKEHVIDDGGNRKRRNIKVPCLHDQAVHHAVIRVTAPFIMKRNYFYNCGSIPGAGQMRATRAMKRWMNKKSICKYAAQMDVRHFYETCPHWAVMKALEHLFKDKRFLALHRRVLQSMGNGLAIGFYPSQWYANLVLMWVDFQIKQKIAPECHYTRYMDDMCLLGNNKKKLHKALEHVKEALKRIGLMMKRNHQVLKIGAGCVRFLSYRFYHGYTLVRKALMLRISRRVKRSGRNPTLHNAQAVVSYLGILRHCDSHRFMEKYIYPRISINKYRRVISNENRTRHEAICAV